MESIFEKEAKRLDYLVERSNPIASQIFKQVREDFLAKSSSILNFLQDESTTEISRAAVLEWFQSGPPTPASTTPQSQSPTPEGSDQ